MNDRNNGHDPNNKNLNSDVNRDAELARYSRHSSGARNRYAGQSVSGATDDSREKQVVSRGGDSRSDDVRLRRDHSATSSGDSRSDDVRLRRDHSVSRGESSRYSASNYGRQPHASAYSTKSSRHVKSDKKIDDSSSATNAKNLSSKPKKFAKNIGPKKIIAIAVAVLLLILISVGAYLFSIQRNLNSGIEDGLGNILVDKEITKEPFYMLLLGTDGSLERENDPTYAGDPTRSDSIMLLRIDPVSDIVTVVSIHRDTMVEIEGHGTQKINAAFAFGGQELMTKTVAEYAGVEISHYAEINFDGFVEIVDALGGIEVDVPTEINDADAGGYLAAGPQVLDGEQALILSRSRHTYDNFGDGDSYRAANQRLVLSAVVNKILQSGPAKMTSSISALSKFVTTDLTLEEIMGLATAFKGFSTAEGFFTGMDPTTPEYIDGVWYEVCDKPAWDEMMKRVDRGLPPNEAGVIDVATGTILATSGGEVTTQGHYGTVAVRNGSEIAGAGTYAGDELTKLGYSVNVSNAAEGDYPETLVIYNDNSDATLAQAIVDHFGAGKAIQNDGSYLISQDFMLVIGDDWPKNLVPGSSPSAPETSQGKPAL